MDTTTNALSAAIKAACYILVLTLVAAMTADGQQSSLQITSPANNTTISPGATLTLTINSSPSGTAFSQLAIMGPRFIGFNVIKPTTMPTQFSLSVPQDADCRVYTLNVDGIPASGGGVAPAQVQIDVEHSDPAIALSAFPASLTFQAQGEQSSLSFTATFTDPTFTNIVAADVTESTLISYVSSNTNVATVDASGRVSAIAPGNAVITATYGHGTTSFPLGVPVTVLSPPITASPASLNFPELGELGDGNSGTDGTFSIILYGWPLAFKTSTRFNRECLTRKSNRKTSRLSLSSCAYVAGHANKSRSPTR